jgi:hypothetical protein
MRKVNLAIDWRIDAIAPRMYAQNASSAKYLKAERAAG